jgi:hypothetical protein
MRKLLLLSGVALAFSGCANGTLTPTAQTDIQYALDVACPIELSVRPIVAAKGNSRQVAADVLLASLCPPNAPPTNLPVAVNDVIYAGQVLVPLWKK